MTEKHTCPRRAELGQRWEENKDVWRKDGKYHTCSYCGSIHPEEFVEACRDSIVLGPTDKTYKVYVGETGRMKFYFQHLSEDQRKQFINMLNDHSLNIGYPGRFYTLPFFVKIL